MSIPRKTRPRPKPRKVRDTDTTVPVQCRKCGDCKYAFPAFFTHLLCPCGGTYRRYRAYLDKRRANGVSEVHAGDRDPSIPEGT